VSGENVPVSQAVIGRRGGTLKFVAGGTVTAVALCDLCGNATTAPPLPAFGSGSAAQLDFHVCDACFQSISGDRISRTKADAEAQVAEFLEPSGPIPSGTILSRGLLAWVGTASWARGNRWTDADHRDWGGTSPLPVGAQALVQFASGFDPWRHGVGDLDAINARLKAMESAWDEPAGYPLGGVSKRLPATDRKWSDVQLRLLPLATRNFNAEDWLGLTISRNVKGYGPIWLFGTTHLVARGYWEFGTASTHLPPYDGNRAAYRKVLSKSESLLEWYRSDIERQRVKHAGRKRPTDDELKKFEESVMRYYMGHPNEPLTQKTMAQLLSVAESTLYEWQREGLIKRPQTIKAILRQEQITRKVIS
jgi:hypothetical protein